MDTTPKHVHELCEPSIREFIRIELFGITESVEIKFAFTLDFTNSSNDCCFAIVIYSRVRSMLIEEVVYRLRKTKAGFDSLSG